MALMNGWGVEDVRQLAIDIPGCLLQRYRDYLASCRSSYPVALSLCEGSVS